MFILRWFSMAIPCIASTSMSLTLDSLCRVPVCVLACMCHATNGWMDIDLDLDMDMDRSMLDIPCICTHQ